MRAMQRRSRAWSLALAVTVTVSAAAARSSAQPAPEGEHGPSAHGGEGSARDMEALQGFRRAEVPTSRSEESAAVPPGSVWVRVVDERGRGVAGASVRLGVLRDGERVGSRDAQTDAEGAARFTELARGMGTAYRVSTESDGARFSAPPFLLAEGAGEAVQLVRLPVSHEPRGVLLSDVRTEITFQEDRLLVSVRASLVNFTNMSLDGSEPRPVAFVPREGLRFRLPEGYSAFRADDRAMGDQRVTEEAGHAVLRGTFEPAAGGEPFEAAFQFRMKLEGRTEVPMGLGLPSVPVLRAVVASQAPAGMQLDVEGMNPAQERMVNGQRVLITGVQRQSREDAEIRRVAVRLRGLPKTAGPSRTVATVAAFAIVALSLASALQRVWSLRRAAGAKVDPAQSRARRAEFEAERARIEESLRLLREARESGEVGPETFARERRSLVEELALVLRALDAMGDAQAPSTTKVTAAAAG